MNFNLDKVVFSLAMLAVLIFCFCMSGCSTMSSTEMAAANVVVSGAAQNAEDVICKMLPIGTWMQRYGTVPAKASAWNTLCNSPATAPVVAP